MLMELPDFDSLKLLADESPEELENLRQYYSQQIIDRAPERLKRRLTGLMFQINMEIRRSNNSMNGCLTISRMMLDSLVDLQGALTNLQAGSNIQQDKKKRELIDNVIHFPSDNNAGHA